MKRKFFTAANIITALRFPLSAAMMLTETFSVSFYVFYVLCGVSDMADGAVARKTGTAGNSGAMLDTAADAVFTMAALIKLLPAVEFPRRALLSSAIIAVIKIANFVISGKIKLPAEKHHTILNKAAGALLFALPLTIRFIRLDISCALCVYCAALAAAEEIYITVKAAGK